VKVHWSSDLGADAVHPTRIPPRTRIARSLIDMAAGAGSDRLARAALLAGVQQRLVTVDGLTQALPSRGPCRRHGLIAETLVDAAGGIHSVPEREFSSLIRRRGLATPGRQRVLRRADGRYYLDADWETYSVAAEVHGSHHRIGLQWDDDLDRHNDITADGRRVLHFSSYAVRHRADRVGDLLAQAL
jgi:very-short-patch-repair endonuclease